MLPEGNRWLHSRMHGELAAEVVRGSPAQVHKELLACCETIPSQCLLPHSLAEGNSAGGQKA